MRRGRPFTSASTHQFTGKNFGDGRAGKKITAVIFISRAMRDGLCAGEHCLYALAHLSDEYFFAFYFCLFAKTFLSLGEDNRLRSNRRKKREP